MSVFDRDEDRVDNLFLRKLLVCLSFGFGKAVGLVDGRFFLIGLLVLYALTNFRKIKRRCVIV